MNNENDENKTTDSQEPSKPEHHENWIERTLDHINEEFPLSGAETDKELIFWEEKDLTPEEIAAKKKSLEENLNKKFPLSGGETEEDLSV